MITQEEHRYGVPVQTWTMLHAPNTTEHDKQTFWRSVGPVRDQLPYIFQKRGEPTDRAPSISVVGTHLLHGRLVLPVYSMILPDGSLIRFRHNLFDWAISVSLSQPLADAGLIEDFVSLFDITTRYGTEEFEGFQADWVLGAFAENQRSFSLKLRSLAEMCTFCFLLARRLNLR